MKINSRLYEQFKEELLGITEPQKYMEINQNKHKCKTFKVRTGNKGNMEYIERECTKCGKVVREYKK